MKKTSRFPRPEGRLSFPATTFLVACALPLPAAQLSYHSAPPKSGPSDIVNLAGAARDWDNIGGDGLNDGDANDSATYIAGVDRPHQGQTFTTGGNPAGYQVNAVWLRHAGYSGNQDATWWCAPAESSLTVRITRPAAAGTFAFALASEPVRTTGAEPGAPNPLAPREVRTSSADGTGLWLRFAFASPVTLYPNTRYGFDVTAHTPDFFLETLGLRDAAASGGDAYAGGSAYTGSSTGTADNTLLPLAGDRVFVVELSPAIDLVRKGHEVFISWPQLSGPLRRVEIYRNDRAAVEGRARVATITTAVNTYLEKVPDDKAPYWYWLTLTRSDGSTETIGPVATPVAEVWTP